MSVTPRRIDYYYTVVEDKHGKGYWLLEHFRQSGVNLIAFTAYPLGGGKSQLDFVTDDVASLARAANAAGVSLVGPKRAFLVQGEDAVGAIAELHQKLATAGISVHAANGVSSGAGGFGYILWVKPDDYEEAAAALGV
ncbi:MAG: hypothetical protein ABIE70_04705 [bacterium]